MIGQLQIMKTAMQPLLRLKAVIPTNVQVRGIAKQFIGSAYLSIIMYFLREFFFLYPSAYFH